MEAHEIARRASALPGQFESRLPDRALARLALMAEGGEYGELAIELAATLAKTRATVTVAEQRDLRALLEATGMPTQPAEQLAVNG
jgi:hypothetical protein